MFVVFSWSPCFFRCWSLKRGKHSVTCHPVPGPKGYPIDPQKEVTLLPATVNFSAPQTSRAKNIHGSIKITSAIFQGVIIKSKTPGNSRFSSSPPTATCNMSLVPVTVIAPSSAMSPKCSSNMKWTIAEIASAADLDMWHVLPWLGVSAKRGIWCICSIWQLHLIYIYILNIHKPGIWGCPSLRQTHYFSQCVPWKFPPNVQGNTCRAPDHKCRSVCIHV